MRSYHRGYSQRLTGRQCAFSTAQESDTIERFIADHVSCNYLHYIVCADFETTITNYTNAGGRILEVYDIFYTISALVSRIHLSSLQGDTNNNEPGYRYVTYVGRIYKTRNVQGQKLYSTTFAAVKLKYLASGTCYLIIWGRYGSFCFIFFIAS